MRWWVLGLLIATVCPALAADYDDSWLRGSQVIGAAPTPPPRLYRIWAGVYGGAQVGEDFHAADFRQVPNAPIATLINEDQVFNSISNTLPGMATLPQVNSNGVSYGGFVGYNWQIDDVVFGAEINVNRSQYSQNVNNYSTQNFVITNGGYLFAPTNVTVDSRATLAMSDYLTLRGRLGWAMGNFLPYIVAGVAFAQVDSSRFFDFSYFGRCVNTSSTTCPIETNPAPPHTLTIAGEYPFSNISHGKYVLGFDGAVGMDYLVTRYVFLRGEVEYINFGTPSDIRLSSISARTAIGLRF
jgi:opacity protein-like surface antigen